MNSKGPASESAARVVAADAAGIASAAGVLARGGLVAFPTETVYGLAADATSAQAVAKLYAAKGRPAFNPLIATVPDLAAAETLAAFNASAKTLARAFWPGPLTLVLRKAPGCAVAELATAGLPTIAVRVPAHRVARDLLAAFGKPIVGPSANRSGHVSATTAAHVLTDLGERIDLILDGGPTPVGVESTIVACVDDDVTLLRPGGLARETIEGALKRPLANAGLDANNDAPMAPGMLASHYAPRARVRLDAKAVTPGEAVLAFGPTLPEGADNAVLVLNLSAHADLVEAAANLFAHLRTLDATGSTSIAVMPVPNGGLGEAINDRLKRAAAPRT